MIFALALGDNKTTAFDIPVKDYISESALPLPPYTEDPTRALKEAFISTSRVNDLISLFKIDVIQKLAPGIHKEGYEDSTSAARTTQQEERREQAQAQAQARRWRDPLREDDPLPRPARPYPFDDPLAAPPPRRPIPGDFGPPGFENEHEVDLFPADWGTRRGNNPLSIGERDLYPPGLGPNDPFRGTLGPTHGGGGSGGMHPTLDDPLFGGFGGGGYYPQAPPGSRYDPVGPGSGLPFRAPFGRRGHGGGFGGGFGGFGGLGGLDDDDII